MADLREAYSQTRSRICDLVLDRNTTVAVPGTPGWTAHDVVSHLTGIAADTLGGVTEGAPGEAWTARQVDERRALTTYEVVAEWTTLGPTFEARFDDLAPVASSATVDAHVHEDDLREAYGLPLAAAPTAPWVLKGLARHTAGRRIREAGLPALRIITSEGDDVLAGEGEGGLTLTTDRAEALRLLAGRRTLTQARALDWSTDPADWLVHLPLFGWMPEG